MTQCFHTFPNNLLHKTWLRNIDFSLYVYNVEISTSPQKQKFLCGRLWWESHFRVGKISLTQISILPSPSFGHKQVSYISLNCSPAKPFIFVTLGLYSGTTLPSPSISPSLSISWSMIPPVSFPMTAKTCQYQYLQTLWKASGSINYISKKISVYDASLKAHFGSNMWNGLVADRIRLNTERSIKDYICIGEICEEPEIGAVEMEVEGTAMIAIRRFNQVSFAINSARNIY